MAAMNTSTALTLRDPWALVPSLGNLDAYIAAVNRLPMLTQEEEVRLARRYREHNDLEAAGKLVLSHLRLVVSVSRQYLGYGLPQGDLIQEGNVGLMKAVKRFDPSQGVRLVSYALHWIKAEIHEYILRNWRMVKLATTKAQRKLFFNLRSLKQSLKGEATDADSHRATLTDREIDAVARELNVKRFDPSQGVRLVSYALHWIKAEIHEYILRNWRMVKLATTKAQRKLFFNLRSLKQSLKGEATDADSHRATLTDREIDAVARELNVKREEVIEMETRLAGGDVALEPSTDDSEESFAPIAYLADESSEPTRVIEAHHRDALATDGIARALDELDARSRRIVEERWLKVNDDGSGGKTLHELASEYGVSAERIRQIEAAAMKKMRKTLAAYA